MGIFDKLFGGGKKKGSKTTSETRGEHMPALNIPVDEKFTIHFKKNGGKFLYCDSFSEISLSLKKIINENAWENSAFYVLNPALKDKFSKENITFSDNKNESAVFFTACEHLIAQNGS
ncbi:MAG: lactate utilization protein B/C, partial [Flavobacteriaceae bacterium]